MDTRKDKVFQIKPFHFLEKKNRLNNDHKNQKAPNTNKNLAFKATKNFTHKLVKIPWKHLAQVNVSETFVRGYMREHSPTFVDNSPSTHAEVKFLQISNLEMN